MHRAEQIRIAIQQRNSEILRRIADHARREEDRLFVALLADLIDQRRKPEGASRISANHSSTRRVMMSESPDSTPELLAVAATNLLRATAALGGFIGVDIARIVGISRENDILGILAG